MLFFGGLAAILSLFALGLLWPHRTEVSLGVALWGYFVKALYLSWIWFLVSYASALGEAARLVSIALAVLIAFQLIYRKIPGAYDATMAPAKLRLRQFTVLVMVLVVAHPAITNFGSIFSAWDAVASWNRWGIELAGNNYAPLQSAYPILWPAIWSLIYEAQGTTTIWFITKASLSAPVIFIALFAADFIKGPHAIAGVILAGLSALCFSTQPEAIVSGYMDIPLALLGLGALLLIIIAVDETEPVRREQFLQLAVISASMAMVTKQGGVIFGAVIALVVVYEAYCKRIALSKLLWLSGIIIFPIATYLYLYYDVRSYALGNLDHLLDLTDRRRGEVNRYIYAYQLMHNVLPAIVTPLLGLGVILNVVFFRSYRGAIGILFLLAGAASFMIFANCCAYGSRNGYFVFSFIIASAFIGYSAFEHWVAQRASHFIFRHPQNRIVDFPANVGVALITALAALAVLAVQWPEQRLIEKDGAAKYATMGSRNANDVIFRNAETISKYKVFATSYAYARFLPVTKDIFLNCRSTSPECINRAKEISSPVLVYSFSTFETDASRKFMKESLANKTARMIDRHGGFILYEFR